MDEKLIFCRLSVVYSTSATHYIIYSKAGAGLKITAPASSYYMVVLLLDYVLVGDRVICFLDGCFQMADAPGCADGKHHILVNGETLNIGEVFSVYPIGHLYLREEKISSYQRYR